MVFWKLEYRFTWIGLGLTIRSSNAKGQEKLVHECGRKRGKVLKRGYVTRGEKEGTGGRVA